MIGWAVALALAPQLHGLRVDSNRAFAGDRALLTTVTPNGDGLRDAAIASNHGERQVPFTATGDAPWAGLSAGERLGATYGIEIDARSPASPPGTVVLARIPDLMGPGRTAEMTYYETPAGAKVFDAGAINFAASLDDPAVSRLVETLWTRLAQP